MFCSVFSSILNMKPYSLSIRTILGSNETVQYTQKRSVEMEMAWVAERFFYGGLNCVQYTKYIEYKKIR